MPDELKSIYRYRVQDARSKESIKRALKTRLFNNFEQMFELLYKKGDSFETILTMRNITRIEHLTSAPEPPFIEADFEENLK